MTTIDYSDDFESGMETVTISREFAYEPQRSDSARYLPVVGRFDNENPTLNEIECVK